MKILLHTRKYTPSVGGMETFAYLMAVNLSRLGHEVVIMTPAKNEGLNLVEDAQFRIIRKPGIREFLRWLRWSDVLFHSGMSLRAAWPLLIVNRPWVITHHTWLYDATQNNNFAKLVKRVICNRAINHTVSMAMADKLPNHTRVIPNPYDNETFYVRDDIERNWDLVFVGRLIPEKGVDLLIDALWRLSRDDLTPSLTIIGDGPEAPMLRDMVSRLDLNERVRFRGTLSGRDLAEELNRHAIMVVPSRWNEPLGIVALEGLACGCVLIGSRGGGLSEAMGEAGLTFPNGDSAALSAIIRDLLTHDEKLARLRRNRAGQLAKHDPLLCARRYAASFEQAIHKSR